MGLSLYAYTCKSEQIIFFSANILKYSNIYKYGNDLFVPAIMLASGAQLRTVIIAVVEFAVGLVVINKKNE